MNYLKRIGSVKEKFYFEVLIESVQVCLPTECFLQVKIKRNKRKEYSPKYPYCPEKHLVNFETRLSLPVTLYRTSSSYTEKKYCFRLVQITGKKSKNNGKATIDISTLSSTKRLSLHLKNCSDEKAFINVSLSLLKIQKTESLNIPVLKTEEHFCHSKSFDRSLFLKSPEEKISDREKFVRRIHKVNSLTNSPGSGLMLDETSSNSSPVKKDFEELAGKLSFESPVDRTEWEKYIGSEIGSPEKERNMHDISEESESCDDFVIKIM